MNNQLTHSESEFENRKFPIILFLDNITGEANIGSIFRLADAFGIDKIVFNGTIPNLNSNRLKRTARNTHNSVSFEILENGAEYLMKKKTENFKINAIEITSESRAIEHFELKNLESIILVAGNERHGISEEILNICDSAYHIEMFGENSSMNVAQSVGITLYEITKAYLQLDKK